MTIQFPVFRSIKLASTQRTMNSAVVEYHPANSQQYHQPVERLNLALSNPSYPGVRPFSNTEHARVVALVQKALGEKGIDQVVTAQALERLVDESTPFNLTSILNGAFTAGLIDRYIPPKAGGQVEYSLTPKAISILTKS